MCERIARSHSTGPEVYIRGAPRVGREAKLDCFYGYGSATGEVVKWELHKRSRPILCNNAGGRGFSRAMQSAEPRVNGTVSSCSNFIYLVTSLYLHNPTVRQCTP